MKLSSQSELIESLGLESTKEIHEFLQQEFVETEVIFHGNQLGRVKIFENPDCFWPRTPMGHRWYSDGTTKVTLLSHRAAIPVKTEVVLFGPNEQQHYNYITMFNGTNVQSFSYTRPKNDTYCHGGAGKTKQVNRYPSSLTTSVFVGTDKRQYIRGHCIDYKDTLDVQLLSSNDTRNFLPEINNEIYWNFIRNHWIADVRKRGGVYMQIPYYDDKSNFHFYSGDLSVSTLSGALVPKGVFLSEIAFKNPLTVVSTYDVSWSFPFTELVSNAGTTYRKCAEKFITVPNTVLPIPVVRNHRQMPLAVEKCEPGIPVIKSHEQVPVSIANSRNQRRLTDFFYHSAENEVVTSTKKVQFAVHLSDVVRDSQGAKCYLGRAKSHAEFLESLDDSRAKPDKAVVDLIKTQHQLQHPGFEDTDDLDFWKSLTHE